MKIKKVSKLIIHILIIFSFTNTMMGTVNASENEQNLEFDIIAEGEGLIVWGFSWMPPYPGESFYLGGPGPDPPLVPIPLFNWGEPDYSAKFTESLFKIKGKSGLDEAPVRTDSPEALPTNLTKFWLVKQNSTGTLKTSWVEADDITHTLEINVMGVNSGGVWVGPPATCPWGHLAVGFISPSLPVQPVSFEGQLDEEPIEGRLHVISWPDLLVVNLWIEDDTGGIYANLIWLDPETYMNHEWLTYWLAFEIELPEFGYGPSDDPLAAWVPTADVLSREMKVGEKTTLQSNARYWSDDFEDKDLDGWKITGYNFEPFFADMMTPPIPIKGNYTAKDGKLQSQGPRKPGLAGVASHPSTVAYGTWSFDIHITDETEEHFYVYFATDDWNEYPLKINSYDLAIVLQPEQAWSWELEENAQAGFVLVKRNGAATEGGWQGLGSYSLDEELSGVYHLDITRNSEGKFKVYLDGNHIISAQDNEHTSATWFRFTGEPGPAIDNIVVKDSIDDLAMQLDEKVSTIQDSLSELQEDKMTLKEENYELSNEKTILEETVNELEIEVSGLETDKASLEVSLSTARTYTVIAVIAGLLIGAVTVFIIKR